MKATDLMIGDWVEVILNSEKHFAQVQMIDGYGDNATSNECVCDAIYYSIDELKPITLTAEILKKNEFRRSNDRYLIGNSLRWEDGSVGIMVDAYESPQFWGILTANYVHELQHILRMCGQTEMADNFKI